MKNFLLATLAILLLAVPGFSQYAPSGVGSTNAAAEVNGKINHQEGNGLPTSVNGTQGKDIYTDTGTNLLFRCLATGTPCTWGRIGAVPFNAQTGTTYTVLLTDNNKLVTHNNASATAVTLPQATGSFGTHFWYATKNLGAGTVTITPTTSTISGASSITLATGEWALIYSDGTNYEALSSHIAQGSNVTITYSRTGPSIASAGGGGGSPFSLTSTTADLHSGTYTSGITTTGSTGNTCILTFSDGATATVALTGTNAIAGSTDLASIVAGSGLTSPPTTATVSTGTASSCTGTPVLATETSITVTTAGKYYNNTLGAVSYLLPTITSGLVGSDWLFSNDIGRSGAITLLPPSATTFDVFGSTYSTNFHSGGAVGDDGQVTAKTTSAYKARTLNNPWTPQ